MDYIKFSNNWNNKLNCTFFTSIRLPHKKYTPGNILLVLSKGEYIYQAKVLHSKEVFLNKLTQFDTMIDAGMERTDFMYMMKKMYPTYDFEKYPLIMPLFKVLEPKDYLPLDNPVPQLPAMGKRTTTNQIELFV